MKTVSATIQIDTPPARVWAVLTDLVLTDPVLTDLVLTDPVLTDLVLTDPVLTDLVLTDLVLTDLVLTDPVLTDLVLTDPVLTDLVLTDLVLTDLAAYPRRGVPPGVLPGLSWRAVAMQDLRLVRVPGGGAVGVEHDGPAHSVDHDLMVVPAEQNAVFHAGLAAVGLVRDMMHLGRRRGLVATPSPPAVLIAQDDGAADRGRDVLANPDVQRQARPAQPGTQLPTPQETRQPARTR